MTRFPLATSSWDGAEQAAIQRVIASDMYSMGAEVAAYEAEFAAFFGARHAVMVNSGSSANLLMTAALFYRKDPARCLRAGDEIIVPAVSWSTTYYPLSQYGLRLRFVDIDMATLNYDMEQLATAITDRTRAVMVVNLLGNPNDFDAIAAAIGDRDIVMIEDNCESMGATWRGRMAGTIGVMGTWSSFFSHHISTMEGGCVTTDDEELYHLMLSLRAHGWTRNLPDENHVTGSRGADPFDESFRFVLPGYNLRPLEMSGAIGREQLKKLPGLIAGRRDNARAVLAAMADHPTLMVQQVPEGGDSSWFGFSLVIRPGADLTRAALLDQLRGAGFEVRPIVGGNFLAKEVIRHLPHDVAEGGVPNAEWIDANGLFVGNHHYPIPEAAEALAAVGRG